MTTTITYEQAVRRRPGLDDLHGDQILDDTEAPPTTGDPNAGAMNQADRLTVAAHRTIDFAKIHVVFNSGTPSIGGVWSLRDTVLVAGDFSVTDNGAGDVSITHTGGKFPAALWPATARPVGNAGDTTANVESITNGWRVRTRTAGSLADVPFLLDVSGL